MAERVGRMPGLAAVKRRGGLRTEARRRRRAATSSGQDCGNCVWASIHQHPRSVCLVGDRRKGRYCCDSIGSFQNEKLLGEIWLPVDRLVTASCAIVDFLARKIVSSNRATTQGLLRRPAQNGHTGFHTHTVRLMPCPNALSGISN
jgi:hypothetical protein